MFFKKKVSCVCNYNGETWTIKVNKGYDIYDLQRYCERKRYIPEGLSIQRTNHFRRQDQTLMVLDGDEFEFIEMVDIPNYQNGVPLYGCPTADDIVGIVPACMLVQFDGYEITEL